MAPQAGVVAAAIRRVTIIRRVRDMRAVRRMLQRKNLAATEA
jgi:hypothetical protein